MSETVTIKKSTLKIASIAIVAFLLGAGLIYLIVAPKTQTQQQTQPVSISFDSNPVIGSKDAPVAIVEFTDFQCPFCRLAAQDAIVNLTKNEIAAGKVKLMVKDFPLDTSCNKYLGGQMHPSACKSAQGFECAAEQGKIVAYHDRIFNEEDKIARAQSPDNPVITVPYSVDDIKKWAAAAGLDSNAFNSCLDSGKYDSEIKTDIDEGQKAGVTGTPTFFIGKVKDGKLVSPVSLVGAQPYSVFQQILNNLA